MRLPMSAPFSFRLLKILLISLFISRTNERTLKLPKICLKNDDIEPRCEMKPNVERVTCTGSLTRNNDYWHAKAVVLCSWTEEYVNPEEILNNFPYAKKLTIYNGSIDEFLTDFPKSDYLQHLALVNLGIKELRPKLFLLLRNLKYLDLSHNQLKWIPPEIIAGHSSLLKVILTDNPWDCSSDLKWIMDKSVNSKIPNKNLLQCGDEIYPEKPVYHVMSLIKKMERDCPEEICTCSMSNIVWDTNRNYLVPVITVNCSDKNLKELPKKLPHNTTSLMLFRNNITSLVPLIRNKAYKSVADIYLDNNQVRSIDVLEGAEWLKTFRVLSLRGNELTQLPIYALDNAFEKNSNMAKVYLSDNPWKCDCSFTPEFQQLLIKYGSVVKDKNEIKCSKHEDDDISNRRVIMISTNSVCRKHNSGVNPLDILSVVLAAMILLILGKLVYDYLTFKRTGKLPWIVTKMP